MLSFAGMEKTQEEQVWGGVVKIRSYVLDILSPGSLQNQNIDYS